MTIDTSRLTADQRRNLRRWSRFPSTLWVSQAKFNAHLERYLGDADRREAESERAEQERQAKALVDDQRAYFRTISKVTTYEGPDYRVHFPGQAVPFRATKHMYEQAGLTGIPRSIGVPEVAELVAA